jgi:hypothetical protein
MNFDLENLISFLKKHTTSKMEFGEQEAGGEKTSGGDSASAGATTVPMWKDIVGGPQRGKANQLDVTVWNTGAKRGVSNQIW